MSSGDQFLLKNSTTFILNSLNSIENIKYRQQVMQAGMFVATESYSGSVVSGIFTHFKHEEDKTMERGKFDE